MSTVNSSNIDNDPFPVFTPRNQQAILTRSPMQQQQQHILNNIQLQQSPYHQQTRFATNANLLRSPNTTQSASLTQPQTTPASNNVTANVNSRMLHPQNYVLQNMVQNLTLTQSPNNNLQAQKLHTPSSTPPPPTAAVSAVPSTSSTSSVPTSVASAGSNHHAHRKLFQVDPTGSQAAAVTSNDPNASAAAAAGGDLNDYEFLSRNRTQAPDLSSILHLKRSDSYFMSDELRNEIMRKNMLLQSTTNAEIASTLPPQIKDYHNLVPLDPQQVNMDHKSRIFGYKTISYKATHIKTNCLCYLKCIIGFRFTNQRCTELVEMWKKIQHANIIALRDVFSTKEFNGEHAIVFVYDYYPGLETLQFRLYTNQTFNLKGWANPYNIDGSARPYSAGKAKIGFNGTRALGLLPESSIWDFVIQLTSIIRTIHSANLACRILTPSRLLIDHKSRLRLSGCAIFDVIDYENTHSNITSYQQEDLMDFGRLVLALSCNSLFATQKEHLNTSIDIISRSYSPDLRNLVLHFLTPTTMMNNRLKSINDAMPMIGARFYTCLDSAYTRTDVIENELAKEVENGRLFRLISKLNIVLDRQDDITWSETGDRYMLKLFRDYVFHQVNSNGSPWIDLSHIVQCLNKFDSGSSDKICLVSPDGQNIMIVTYNQLKKCFDKVFNELTSMMNV